MHAFSHIAFCSGGNDSLALIQYLRNADIDNVCVLYNNTHWAADFWQARLDAVRAWVDSLGYRWITLDSEGMETLVKRKKGWPAPQHGMQFCTEQLKIKPSCAWLERHDPDKELVCCVGVRREESSQRAHFPEYTESSANHAGRALWAPLVRHTQTERDILLSMTPFSPLPHGSRECSPCIYANRADIRELPETKLLTIERIERELGYTKRGKLRSFFRPHRQMGATGIREAVRWAWSERGKYEPPPSTCSSGFCGT